ncbi:MAG TPA: hypothetical protein VHO03_16965 [Ignavibacteriales bacterium]|nr:hypothetical protein [Ignavibacteriales bacterium]
MITVNGKTYSVPDVYFTTEVINLGANTIPAFNGLLHIGSARKGIPYTAGKGYEVIKAFSDVPSVKKFYGAGELSEAFEQAKAGGAGTDYFLNAAKLTRGVATIMDNAGTPASCFDITPKEYGAHGNDISFKIATVSTTLTITVIPPKATKFLSANASTTNKEISLDEVEGLFVGQTGFLVSNTVTTPQAVTITAVDAVNKKITVDVNPTSAFATADYARFFSEDTDNEQVLTFDTASATVKDIIAGINAGSILTADRKDYTGVVPTTMAKAYLQAITGATKGTSPAATEIAGGDYDLLGGMLPQLFEEFTNFTKARIRLVNLLTPTSSVHMIFKTVALTLRGIKYPIQVITGCAKGDLDKELTDADYPIQRLKALNSSDVILCVMGLDDKAAYISLAPQLAGLMAANSVKHNLTWDTISATKVEKFYGESNRESALQPLINAGAIVVRTGDDGFFIAQGLNSYQKHDKEWNTEDKTSYLIMQVGIVDFVNEGINKGMKVGSDDSTVNSEMENLLGILKSFSDQGFITNYGVSRSERIGNAIYLDPQYAPVNSTDFVGGTVKVIIPN